MKIAYLDCASGISGDMTLAVLVDAGVPLDALNDAVASLGLPGCRLRAQEVQKNGFRAMQVVVEHQHEHAHRHLSHILGMIDAGRLSERQKELARRIFTRLGEVEAKVHGVPVEKVHFHEVGAADSIADIVGAAVAWDILGVERLVASPVPVGNGTITIAHGKCSVPAPATAELLRGVPIAPSAVEGELTTPTGAAILTTIADSFGPMPAMTIEKIGYSAGQKDFVGCPGVLRLLVGQTSDEGNAGQPVCVIETNLDDISGELVGYCTERLFEAGALDVFTTAIQMKKNRPGVMLTVICRAETVAAVEEVIFRETTTLGIRRSTVDRATLRRQPHSVATPWGAVEGKIGWLADGVARFSPEFESCRRIAQANGLPLREVYDAAQKEFNANDVK